MKPTRYAAALAAIAATGTGGFCFAQNADFGKHEYDGSCAACHGKQGKGDGPYSGVVPTPTSDLTVLARKNNGVFPFQHVYEVIDGRRSIKAHGTSDMPIWGRRYLAIAGEHYFDVPYDPEAFVHTRILALTEYISRIQAQ